jgi:hypothetical protein
MPKLSSASPLSKLFKRDRWSAVEARQFLASWPSERISLCAFARQHGVDPRRLYWWRGRLGQATPPGISFKEISLPQSEVPPTLEVVLRSGLVVRVGKSFDEAALRRLLEVLTSVTA